MVGTSKMRASLFSEWEDLQNAVFFRIKASCTLEFERLMTTKINLKFQLLKSFFPRVSDKGHSKKML